MENTFSHKKEVINNKIEDLLVEMEKICDNIHRQGAKALLYKLQDKSFQYTQNIIKGRDLISKILEQNLLRKYKTSFKELYEFTDHLIFAVEIVCRFTILQPGIKEFCNNIDISEKANEELCKDILADLNYLIKKMDQEEEKFRNNLKSKPLPIVNKKGGGNLTSNSLAIRCYNSLPEIISFSGGGLDNAKWEENKDGEKTSIDVLDENTNIIITIKKVLNFDSKYYEKVNKLDIINWDLKLSRFQSQHDKNLN